MQLPIQIFEYQDSEDQRTTVRSVYIQGEIWFYAVDVCHALDIANPSNAYARLESDDLHTMEGVDSQGRKAHFYIISEYGLYDLVLYSRKDEAKRFKRWITHEVLPNIRRTGTYTMGPSYLPAFVRRFNENWDRVDKGYFSVINELFIRVYGRLEQLGHHIPDKGRDGREIRPDVSVGLTFPKWLERHYPGLTELYDYYSHRLPIGVSVDARQYENRVLPAFLEFIDDYWIPYQAQKYFEKRDPQALEYLPKLVLKRRKEDKLSGKDAEEDQ